MKMNAKITIELLLLVNATILPLEKLHLVAKNEFSFRPTWKDQQVGGNMLMWR